MSASTPAPGTGRGAVVLAAYRPDPELFTTQLRSIQSQTHRNFVCLVGADSGVTEVRELVAAAVGGDDRFVVVGWEDNVGFYLNFERLLEQVPDDCTWVALSDHDDRWYDDKLARLLPGLRESVLVTGLARVVDDRTGAVLQPRTERRVVAPGALLLQNQVSGALCVFRRDLLDVALPFPRLHTVTQLHDHWLAMCAVAVGSYAVVDEVVQDYVQHASNVVGESGNNHRQFGPGDLVRELRALAADYQGDSGLASCLRAARDASFGWRSAMLDTLADRASLPVDLARTRRRVHSQPGAIAIVASALCTRDVALSVAATFVAGLPGQLMSDRHPITPRAAADAGRLRRGEAI
ncbi:Glycosyl transferase family 2 [Pedococcus dokdonensis]|uniref:Glycosyl transferase family 2 n=1 Tax=Pedococcus dokdonensis TaxID=443156 RepID=A0A1H0RB42_9MICO|nr:glycosyltransferase [Pedococcus dokdonensis]SDP26802.1 Glycosyl transferase family 2 [Pedococcus dokdonensis]